jgi:hypothetical protein
VLQWRDAVQACFLLYFATALGLLLAVKLEVELGPCTRVAAGVALGQVLLLWVPFLCACALRTGARDSGAIATALFAAAYVIGQLRRSQRAALGALLRQARAGVAARENRAIVLVAAGFAGLFAWLLHTHYFMPRADGLHSAGVTWGDLPMHAALVSRFAAADGAPSLEHPLFLGGPLTYPFLPDYSVAVLSELGWSSRAAFIVGSLVPLCALLVLLHGLVRCWFDVRGTAVSALGVALFLLAGGLGFAFVLPRWFAGEPLLALLAGTNATYLESPVVISKSGTIGNLLIAARTAAYGMPIGCCALLLLGRALRDPRPALSTLAVSGLSIGALPLIHGHSFLVLGGVAAAYPLLARRFDRGWLLCYALIGIAALPQLLWLASAGAPSYARVELGFLREQTGVLGWAADLVLGVGVWLVVVPLAWWAAPARARLLSAPLLLLLPLANVVTFTPAVYDNVKLTAWFDLGAAPLVAAYLARALASRRVLAAVLAVGCTLSGALAVGTELTNDGYVMSYADQRWAEFVAAHTRPSAVIATAASYHDPVAMLSGRRVLLAAPRMLDTHGIDARPRARDVLALYAGGPAALEVIARLHVTAVVVGPRERRDIPRIDEAFLRAHARARYEQDGRQLYVLVP